jgi:hypothetical protein
MSIWAQGLPIRAPKEKLRQSSHARDLLKTHKQEINKNLRASSFRHSYATTSCHPWKASGIDLGRYGHSARKSETEPKCPNKNSEKYPSQKTHSQHNACDIGLPKSNSKEEASQPFLNAIKSHKFRCNQTINDLLPQLHTSLFSLTCSTTDHFSGQVAETASDQQFPSRDKSHARSENLVAELGTFCCSVRHRREHICRRT